MAPIIKQRFRPAPRLRRRRVGRHRLPGTPCMLRLTELKLPLDHAEDAIAAAIVHRLGIAAADLRGYSVFRRAYDARRRSAIALIYTLDIDVADEAAVRAR